MKKHPKFDELEHLFDGNVEFTLPEKEYEKLTGASLPRNKKYLINQSAFSKWLQERGWSIVNVEEPTVERTVRIEKRST